LSFVYFKETKQKEKESKPIGFLKQTKQGKTLKHGN
jgi:hypothetical protein